MPPRAQYLRVIHLELNRIMSHLVWLGTSALDLGAISMFWYCFRERETILDLFEMSSGQRMHTRYIQVGGVMEDIPRGFAEKLRKFLKEMPTRADQYADLLEKNEIVLERLRGTCVVDQETLLKLGVTGPLLRATGNPWDLRKAAPYSSYDHFDFKIPVGTVGDNYDRFRVRHAELYESVKIIEQALDGLPEGPHITTDRKVALPPRHELATSMEALIHHFKLVTEGFRVPPGEAYYPIEGPRGELGCFVRSDGSAKPARVHMRDPSFVNLQALAADGPGRLHRRPDRDAGDARSDPRGDRPVSPAIPVPRFDHGSRVPGWDEAVDLTKDRRRRFPTRRRRRSRTSCGGDRGGDGQVPRPPLGRDPGAPRRPALPRLVLARGDRPGRRGDAGDPRLPDLGRDLLRHARDVSPAQAPRRLRVHQHLLLAARRRRAARGDDRRQPPCTSTSTCARSSASAPATSPRWPRWTGNTSAR